MNFLCFGDKNKKTILFIHGMSTTAMICYEPLLEHLSDYYVILAEIDGHSERTGKLVSLKDNCDEIENYIIKNLNGQLFCLSGFSMGATLAVEVLSRGHIRVEKTHLDGAFLVQIGMLKNLYKTIFTKAISRIKAGKKIPKFLMDSVMGKDNNSVVEMLYSGITTDTIKTACEYVYTYKLPEQIGNYKEPILYWYGANEYYPKKGAALLKKYCPNLIEVEMPQMGHGQYLHEHSDEYASKLLQYLQQ